MLCKLERILFLEQKRYPEYLDESIERTNIDSLDKLLQKHNSNSSNIANPMKTVLLIRDYWFFLIGKH